MTTEQSFLIEGGNSLHGSVRCSGAKNSILPLVAAAIAVRDVVSFQNVPDISDLQSHVNAEEQRCVNPRLFPSGDRSDTTPA